MVRFVPKSNDGLLRANAGEALWAISIRVCLVNTSRALRARAIGPVCELPARARRSCGPPCAHENRHGGQQIENGLPFSMRRVLYAPQMPRGCHSPHVCPAIPARSMRTSQSLWDKENGLIRDVHSSPGSAGHPMEQQWATSATAGSFESTDPLVLLGHFALDC